MYSLGRLALKEHRSQSVFLRCIDGRANWLICNGAVVHEVNCLFEIGNTIPQTSRLWQQDALKHRRVRLLRIRSGLFYRCR